MVTIEPRSESPVHSHANEQWGVCLESEPAAASAARHSPAEAAGARPGRPRGG